MTECTPSVAKSVLRTLIQAQRPGFLWGPPGIGKSQIVQQVAAELEMECRDIRMILLDPVDLRGLPSVTVAGVCASCGHRESDHDAMRGCDRCDRADFNDFPCMTFIPKGITHWNAPDFLPTDGRGILFLDELNRAPALVQNAGFQLILDRKLGDYTLPPGWSVIGAGNREQDGGGVSRMSSALANRFVHIEVTTDLMDWRTWASQPLDPEASEKFSRVDQVVIAFLTFRPNLLHEFDRDAHAFPTPRSWTFVSDVTRARPARDAELALIEGSVGHGAAVEFLAFVDLWRKLPNMDAILMDPVGSPVPNVNDVGTMYAISAALGSRATPENFERVLKYLARIPIEYAVFSVRDAVNRDQSLTSTPAFVDWAVANQDIF